MSARAARQSTWPTAPTQRKRNKELGERARGGSRRHGEVFPVQASRERGRQSRKRPACTTSELRERPAATRRNRDVAWRKQTSTNRRSATIRRWRASRRGKDSASSRDTACS